MSSRIFAVQPLRRSRQIGVIYIVSNIPVVCQVLACTDLKSARSYTFKSRNLWHFIQRQYRLWRTSLFMQPSRHSLYYTPPTGICQTYMPLYSQFFYINLLFIPYNTKIFIHIVCTVTQNAYAPKIHKYAVSAYAVICTVLPQGASLSLSHNIHSTGTSCAADG